MTGFFEVSKGNKSMLRLMAFIGMILGAVVTLWGMVLFTLLINAVLNNVATAASMAGNVVLVISAGIGLAAGGEALKTIQASIEKKAGS